MKFPQLTHKPFRKVLIANRGEIGVRVIRACRDLNLSPIAVYSEADLHSKHVSLADEAYCIGAGPSSESYLNVENILKAAKISGAEAVHPGFGFLSENAEFAAKVIDAGMVWIGPSPESIFKMGDKTLAKRTVAAAGVPCSPGKNEPLIDAADLKKVAAETGFPLILKAAAGGGGRGMRVVRQNSELEASFEACSREALSYFGNPNVFCEKYIEHPRHVEIQVLADKNGHTIHLFERDCTIQRRHQKLIEEAPSSYISQETRLKMGEVAVKAAQAVGYCNAGTVEFILESPENFYFMEMNTRIQVEHPVTEVVTGVDLVQWQLRVAMGENLSLQQKDISIRGWCMETRINAEDPFQGFRPDPGTITALEFPHGPGVRVDSHIYEGYKVPEFYDSMIAKLIVNGQNRQDCLRKLRRAIGETVIEGIATTLPYTQALLENKHFQEGVYTTRFIEQNEKLLQNHEQTLEPHSPEMKAAIAIAVEAKLNGRTQNSQGGNSQGANLTAQSDGVFESPWQTAARLEASRRNS